jgi:hypothetical protein
MLVLHLGGLRGLVRWPRHEGVLGHVRVGPASAEAGGDPSREEAGSRPRADPESLDHERDAAVPGVHRVHRRRALSHDRWGWSRTPNWWWPDDRAWIVVSELDAPSTYIGGSAALTQAILDEPQLEAVPSHPDHRFDWLGDRINASG